MSLEDMRHCRLSVQMVCCYPDAACGQCIIKAHTHVHHSTACEYELPALAALNRHHCLLLIIDINVGRKLAPTLKEFCCGRVYGEYNFVLEKHSKSRKYIECLEVLEKDVDLFASQELQAVLGKLDSELIEVTIFAEKKCRNICMMHYKFSPKVNMWLDLCRA